MAPKRQPPTKAQKRHPSQSSLEALFALHLKAHHLTDVQREYRFHATRQWRFDFAFVPQKLAVEIEGGVWKRSRHTTGDGFHNDCDKYNAAIELGWSVLRFTSKHLESGQAIDTTMRCLELRQE